MTRTFLASLGAPAGACRTACPPVARMATSRTLLGGKDGDDQNLLSVVRGIGRCSSDGLSDAVLRTTRSTRLRSARLHTPRARHALHGSPADSCNLAELVSLQVSCKRVYILHSASIQPTVDPNPSLQLASASGLQSPPSKAAASEAPAGDKDGDEQHGRCCRPANPPQTGRQW